MPVYQFYCEDCGKTFEKNLKFDQGREGVRCPTGHIHVHKVFSSPVVIYKGSGFYTTDHPKSSH